MRKDRYHAVQLRKRGKSYSEISRQLGIPKSTMHYWFRDLLWSQEVKERQIEKARRLAVKNMKIVAEAQRRRWALWREQHCKEARQQYPRMKSSRLFLVGIMLYWGEGDHGRGNVVRLINTDPRIIYIFSKFLREICLVPDEKIRCALYLYRDLNERICKSFWGGITNVPKQQFHRTQFLVGRHPTKRTARGMCSLGVSSQGLKEKLFIWEDLCYRDFKNAGVA